MNMASSTEVEASVIIYRCETRPYRRINACPLAPLVLKLKKLLDGGKTFLMEKTRSS